MDFTFGIITGGDQTAMIETIINSIEVENIPNYEIIIVGRCNVERKNTTMLDFPENLRPMWITKKKNIIANIAKYQNIVFLHDYIALCKGWYEGFLRFGNEGWDVCMNKIVEKNGKRAVDWMGLPNDPIFGNVLHSYHYCNPPGMYVPGNYFVCKKDLILKHPLDENRGWCEGEDIEWSKRIFGGADNSEWLRNILRIPMNIHIPDPNPPARYKMNIHSQVIYLKDKETPSDYYTEFDLHSGDNSRRPGFRIEEYYYMQVRKGLTPPTFSDMFKSDSSSS